MLAQDFPSQDNPSIADCIRYGQQQLAELSDSAKLDTQILLADALDKEVSYLLTWPEKTLNLTQAQQFYHG